MFKKFNLKCFSNVNKTPKNILFDTKNKESLRFKDVCFTFNQIENESKVSVKHEIFSRFLLNFIAKQDDKPKLYSNFEVILLFISRKLVKL